MNKLRDRFLHELNALRALRHGSDQLLHIYFHLFSVQEIEALERALGNVLSEYEENQDPEYWFVSFHKSLRNTDWFYRAYVDDYDVLGAEIREMGPGEAKAPKRTRTVKRTIGSHLDMALWNTISMDADKNGELQKFLTKFLKDELLDKTQRTPGA